MASPAQIVDKLNAYDGDNIWQDVILGLDGYSEAKTDQIEHGSADRFALDDGTVIRWDAQTDTWHETDETVR